jgi:hypothetical protein
MGAPFDFAVSLRIVHPDIDPAVVSAALSMAPKYSWKAGDPRVTPKGNPLGGTRKESYCTFDVARGGDGEVAERLAEAIERLAEHREFLGKLKATGGSAMFYVFWYPNGDTGEIFGADLLAQMGRLGIDLGLNVFDDRQNDEA